MMSESIFGKLSEKLSVTPTVKIRGRVKEVIGTVVKAVAPEARIGDVVQIHKSDGEIRLAEVVGFRDQLAVLMPLGSVDGIGPQAEITSTGEPFSITVGHGLLGRVVDGLGAPIDGLGDIDGQTWSIMRSAPHPLSRAPISESVNMGVRAIDGLLTVGRGQRVGLFAGSGVGKSTLLAQLAQGTESEITIICLVGERGREVRDFIEHTLTPETRKRTVIVCATSDQPSLVRLKSAFVATAIAEWFRDQGKDVLLMMDSVTRFARAQREVGLAAGEPPARRGYPPSVFALLPQLLERAGKSEKGSITAIYTILVAGGDMDEPIADEVRGILDGHIILDRKLASRNHWPAIDILSSLSRVMNRVVSPDHNRAAGKFRALLAAYESKRDLIILGAYEYGADEQTDLAIDLIDDIESFLRQGHQEFETFENIVRRLEDLTL